MMLLHESLCVVLNSTVRTLQCIVKWTDIKCQWTISVCSRICQNPTNVQLSHHYTTQIPTWTKLQTRGGMEHLATLLKGDLIGSTKYLPEMTNIIEEYGKNRAVRTLQRSSAHFVYSQWICIKCQYSNYILIASIDWRFLSGTSLDWIESDEMSSATVRACRIRWNVVCESM